MSVVDLVALRDKVQAELSRKIEVERLALEKQIAALSELESGQAVALVADKATRGRPRKTDAPKSSKRKPAKRRATARYQGPNGENWSGFGRAPRWLTDLEAAGEFRETFRVAE